VVRHVVDAGLRLEPVADIAHDGHAQLFALVVQGAHDEFHRDACAVAVQDGAVVADFVTRAHDLDDPRAHVWRDKVHRRAAHQVGQGLAHQRQQGRVGIGDHAALVKHDAFFAGVHELGQALFGFAQRRFGLAVARDVADEHKGAVWRGTGLAHVRQQVHFHVAAQAVGVDELTLVADGHTVLDGTVHLRLDQARRLLANDLRHRQAQD
jgi:hypothetical protein